MICVGGVCTQSVQPVICFRATTAIPAANYGHTVCKKKVVRKYIHNSCVQTKHKQIEAAFMQLNQFQQPKYSHTVCKNSVQQKDVQIEASFMQLKQFQQPNIATLCAKKSVQQKDVQL